MLKFVCCCLVLGCVAVGSLRGESLRYAGLGGDEVRYQIQRAGKDWEILVVGAGADRPEQVWTMAVGTNASGSPLVPASEGLSKADLWLPFHADVLIAAVREGADEKKFIRRWDQTQWGAWGPADDSLSVVRAPAQLRVRIPGKLIGNEESVSLLMWMNDLAGDDGRGRVYGVLESPTASGPGVRVINAGVALVRENGREQLVRQAVGDAPRLKILRGDISGEATPVVQMGFTHRRVVTMNSEPDPLGLKKLVDFDAAAVGTDNLESELKKIADSGAAGVYVINPGSLSPDDWREVIDSLRKDHVDFVWVAASERAAARDFLIAGFAAIDTADTAPGTQDEDALFLFDRMVRTPGGNRGLTAWRFAQSRGPVMVDTDGSLFREDEVQQDFYRRLLSVLDEPAMRFGDFFSLETANADNSSWDGGEASNVAAGLRYDPQSGQRMLVVANLNASEPGQDLSVRVPAAAMRFLGWDAIAGSTRVKIAALDRLGELGAVDAELWVTPAEIEKTGLKIRELPAGAAAIFELKQTLAVPVGS